MDPSTGSGGGDMLMAQSCRDLPVWLRLWQPRPHAPGQYSIAAGGHPVVSESGTLRGLGEMAGRWSLSTRC